MQTLSLVTERKEKRIVFFLGLHRTIIHPCFEKQESTTSFWLPKLLKCIFLVFQPPLWIYPQAFAGFPCSINRLVPVFLFSPTKSSEYDEFLMKPSSRLNTWSTDKFPPVNPGDRNIYVLHTFIKTLDLVVWVCWPNDSVYEGRKVGGTYINLTDLGQITDPTLIRESKHHHSSFQ